MCERDQKPEKVAKSGVQIVHLDPDSWQILRDLKIKSLLEEPIAFENQEPGLERYRSRTEEEWRKKLDENASNTVSVFAQDGIRFVGMVSGVIRPSGETATVQHMYVDPEYRGQKISKKLLETLLGKLKEKGVKTALLAVVEGQDPAMALYKNLDFKETGRVQAWRGDSRVTEIEMEKAL